MAQHYGDTKAIEDAGGKIYHQTCMAMTPFRHHPKNSVIATSSFKYVKLCAGFGAEGTTWIYANPEAIINAAVTGVFTPTARWDYWSQLREKRLASEKDKPLYDGNKAFIS